MTAICWSVARPAVWHTRRYSRCPPRFGLLAHASPWHGVAWARSPTLEMKVMLRSMHPNTPPPPLRLSGVGPPLQSPPGVRKWAAARAPRLERPWQPNSDRYGRALRRLNGAVSVQIRPPPPTILDCLRMTDVVTRLAWRRLGTRAHCSAPGARVGIVVRGHSE